MTSNDRSFIRCREFYAHVFGTVSYYIICQRIRSNLQCATIIDFEAKMPAFNTSVTFWGDVTIDFSEARRDCDVLAE